MNTILETEIIRSGLSGRTSLVLVPPLEPQWPGNLWRLVRAIGRQTKQAAKAIGRALVTFGKYAKRKLDEGAEIHNRATTMLDERYQKNWYHIRSTF